MCVEAVQARGDVVIAPFCGVDTRVKYQVHRLLLPWQIWMDITHI